MNLPQKTSAKADELLDVNIWSEIYQRVWIENSKLLENYFESINVDALSKNWQKPLTIFDPEIISDTYQKAFQSWLSNPDRLQDLQQEYYTNLQNIFEKHFMEGETYDATAANQKQKDKRFRDVSWDSNPMFRAMKEVYLLTSDFANQFVDDNEDLDCSTAQKLKFYTRQLVSMASPSNFPSTNPEVLNETLRTKGENLIAGFENFMKDLSSGRGFIQMSKLDEFELGKNIATTPGKVVFQNELFQLIQYAPTTEKTFQQPLLIIPPWINKYYVFDLKPENSFVRWAVAMGYTVFMLSWVNPDERHADMTMTNYVIDGILAASDAVRNITNERQMNVLGYCTGGVALTCLLSYLAQKKDDRFNSATVIAAPIDFSEAGDLLVYVCDKQLKKLEEHVNQQGYLDGSAMVASFNLLRSNDLIWSFYINNYLLGREPMPFDMLHWNCDSVRMPAKMHLDFLRSMYLENKLIQPGGIKIDGTDIDLGKITTPLYVMAAIDDHIAPWSSVYPLAQQVSGPAKFILGASGHVAGVFNSVNKNKYYHWTGDAISDKLAATWLDSAEQVEGSWWPNWLDWLQDFSGNTVNARIVDEGFVIESAPGSYALTQS